MRSDSMTLQKTVNTSSAEKTRLQALLGELGISTSRKDLEALGITLASLITRPKPFTYRHLLSVARGSIGPGKGLQLAISAMLASLDGAHPLSVTAQVNDGVLYHQGGLRGVYVMGPIKICPKCLLKFVPNHPSRKYCPICRPPR